MTLEHRNTEVQDLKVKLAKALAEMENLECNLQEVQEYKFKCENCEFKCSTDILLKEHMMEHEASCKFCDSKFKTSEALRKHTCKQNIGNAEYKQFYLKNWILTHGCTGIYNKHQLKEIAVLHNETCWTHVCPCRELPGWHCGNSLHDGDGIFHAKRRDFIENGVVSWSDLCKEF